MVLGVGNELKCDDGVGPFIINKLKDECIENENLMFIDAKTVPENFTGKIRKESPTHLIIVDACMMDSEPGNMEIVDKYDFANIGLSTHSMSLSFFVRYLEKDIDSEIIFVGIEPESMDWADNPTERVENAAYKFIDALKGCIL
jgi:hydrogenase 3 maturation protease